MSPNYGQSEQNYGLEHVFEKNSILNFLEEIVEKQKLPTYHNYNQGCIKVI